MEIKRLFDFLTFQLEKHPQALSLSSKAINELEEKEWQHFTYKEFQDYSDKVSQLLLNSGLQKGDKIAIISANRPEWNFVDIGSQQIGLVNIPMYPTISQDDYEFIFKDADIRYVFVGDETIYEKVRPLKSKMPSIIDIVSFDEIEKVAYFPTKLSEVEVDSSMVSKSKALVDEQDVATIIYTSGTTGYPKGVMLTHLNIVSNLKSIAQVLPLVENEKALSFLPLCHSFERAVFFAYLMMDIHIYYAESIDTIALNLQEVQPYCFTTVPRLLEKVYERIIEKGNELTGLKRSVFSWSMSVGGAYRLGDSQSLWYQLKLYIARKLVFSKWKEALGGRVEFIVTGAAAMQPRLITLFSAAGINVIEGYGLTETSPVISVNRISEKERCVGTIGLPLPGVEVKLAEDGEILARGKNIMKGYYNRPDLTAEVIDEDGWFHTGDIGQWVDHMGNQLLKITDRKKELFKTAGGKYIAPQAVENKMKESAFIEQMMVTGGDDRKYIAALIVPSFVLLKEWAKEKGIQAESNHQLIEHPQVIELFEKEVDRLNKHFGKWEQIKKIKLLPNEWTIESGQMTPTLKVKRKVIQEQFETEINELFV